jgi:hypothetical protein
MAAVGEWRLATGFNDLLDQSPFANRCLFVLMVKVVYRLPFANRYSPLAAFDLPICPSHDLPKELATLKFSPQSADKFCGHRFRRFGQRRRIVICRPFIAHQKG